MGIKVKYADEAGALYASRPLDNCLPKGVDAAERHQRPPCRSGFARSTMPRDFPWRGMHPRRLPPLLSAQLHQGAIWITSPMMKMNVFHWHLVDDGGVAAPDRPNIRRLNQHRSMAIRHQPPAGDQGQLRFDPESKLPKYGGFYSKAEVRDIVKYAAPSAISRSCPRIEMPGHAMPVFRRLPRGGPCLNQPPSGLTGQPPDRRPTVPEAKTPTRFIDNVLLRGGHGPSSRRSGSTSAATRFGRDTGKRLPKVPGEDQGRGAQG